MSTVKKIQYKKGLHASPGMSLIELIVVMGIFIVLVTSIRFFPIDFFYAQSLNDDATKIAFTLRGTRDRAVAQDAESMWGVHFVNESTETDYYQVFKGDTFAEGAVVERVNLNETVQFTSPSLGSSEDVLFSKLNGLPTGANSLIISLISEPTETKTITVLENGQVDY